MQLPLETPLPRQCEQAMPLLEAIERRAATFGVPVDSRIEIVVLRPAVAHQPADGESPLTA